MSAVSKDILLDSTGQDIIDELEDIAAAITDHTPESIIDDTTTSTASVWSSNKTNSMLSTKVDAVSGKGLSTEDYTTSEKTKLSGIEAQANKTIVDNQLSSTSENPVQNKIINGAINTINQAISTLPTSETGSEWANKEELNTELVGQFVREIDRMFSTGLPQESTMGRVITQLALGNGLLNDLYLGMEVS